MFSDLSSSTLEQTNNHNLGVLDQTETYLYLFLTEYSGSTFYNDFCRIPIALMDNFNCKTISSTGTAFAALYMSGHITSGNLIVYDITSGDSGLTNQFEIGFGCYNLTDSSNLYAKNIQNSSDYQYGGYRISSVLTGDETTKYVFYQNSAKRIVVAYTISTGIITRAYSRDQDTS